MFFHIFSWAYDCHMLFLYKTNDFHSHVGLVKAMGMSFMAPQPPRGTPSQRRSSPRSPRSRRPGGSPRPGAASDQRPFQSGGWKPVSPGTEKMEIYGTWPGKHGHLTSQQGGVGIFHARKCRSLAHSNSPAKVYPMGQGRWPAQWNMTHAQG